VDPVGAEQRIGVGPVTKAALAITRSSRFLASPAVNVDRLAEVDRPLLNATWLICISSWQAGTCTHGASAS
jgi:hypothetical protein